MKSLSVQIVRFVNKEPQPGAVACEFVDAYGQRHTLIDKTAIFSAEDLDASSRYPRVGSAVCEILARWKDVSGREFVRITTDTYGIESTEGLSEFVVLSTQIS